MAGWSEVCRRCGRIRRAPTGRWRCGCAGLLDLHGPGFSADGEPGSIWRYRHALPATGSTWSKITLGEGHTPLVRVDEGLWLKLDHVMPTGSFKDRGAAVMVAFAADLGVTRAVADSSGNAGVAIAAYCARAGIALRVFVPGTVDPSKRAVMEACGAEVVTVAEGRDAAAAEARRQVDDSGDWYASHVFQQAFVHGVKTLAFELWEQLGRRAPATVLVPAGNGTLVAGLWLGFRELGGAVPRIVAVQAARCAPLAGLTPSGETVASGIAIPSPPKGAEVRAALAATGGEVVTVTDDEIDTAQAALARMGCLVEPTAAVGWAGLRHAARIDGQTVVVLTGRAH